MRRAWYVFQIVLGMLGLARLLRFVPRSVMVGFVNSLAILVFMAQVPEMRDVPWPVYPLIVAGLVLMVFFPRITRAVPAPLGVGSITAMVIFAKRVAHMATVTRHPAPDGRCVAYTVQGELFFASSNDLVTQFEYAADPPRVVVDLSATHIWDASSVAALDAVTTKYEERGKTVEIIGLNADSARIHGALSGELTGSV